MATNLENRNNTGIPSFKERISTGFNPLVSDMEREDALIGMPIKASPKTKSVDKLRHAFISSVHNGEVTISVPVSGDETAKPPKGSVIWRTNLEDLQNGGDEYYNFQLLRRRM